MVFVYFAHIALLTSMFSFIIHGMLKNAGEIHWVGGDRPKVPIMYQNVTSPENEEDSRAALEQMRPETLIQKDMIESLGPRNERLNLFQENAKFETAENPVGIW